MTLDHTKIGHFPTNSYLQNKHSNLFFIKKIMILNQKKKKNSSHVQSKHDEASTIYLSKGKMMFLIFFS